MPRSLRPSAEEAPDWPALGRALRHGWRVVLAASAGGLAVGVAIVLLSRPAYTAETTLQIDREAQRVAPLGEAPLALGLTGGDDYVQTQYGLLRGRALAARVAASLGLDGDGRFVAAMRGERAAVDPDAAHRARDVLELLRRHYGVAPRRGSRLVTLSFTSPTPDLSARIVGAFAEAFIQAGLERRFQASAYARSFLQSQLTAAKNRLEGSEQGLADYAAAEGIVPLPGGDGAGRSLTADSLETFNTALAGARTERIEAEARWREGRSAGLAGPDVLQSATVQQISQDRARLAADYQDRSRVYKPDYPDMLQLKARMDETDRQLTRQGEEIVTSLHARFAAARAAETALAAQVAGLRAALVDLRRRSIRYTILQREVDTNRVLYDSLLQRYKDVDVAGGVVADNIAIVDPATPPDRPSWPRPLATLMIAGLAGLMAGTGAVLASRKAGPGEAPAS